MSKTNKENGVDSYTMSYLMMVSGNYQKLSFTIKQKVFHEREGMYHEEKQKAIQKTAPGHNL